jgi:hypothetical protein
MIEHLEGVDSSQKLEILKLALEFESFDSKDDKKGTCESDHITFAF